MRNQTILSGVIGLFIGMILTGLVASLAVNNNYGGMMQMMGMHQNSTKQEFGTDHADMSMSDMSGELTNLTGDAYDKAFIDMMISHHQGAIDMSVLSSTRAKHDEVKKLSQDIITAQEKEISQMKQWQQTWGYSSGDSTMETMHGSH